MIHQVEGDILLSKAEVVAHGIAANDPMNQGLALARPGKATVKFVGECLKALAKMVEKEGFTSIALPRLATGVGGLDWDEVSPVIERRLGDLKIPVYVYATYRPGKQAAEPGL